MIVGRWLWESGTLKAGSLIPWEKEAANTIPDHFFWEKNKTSILVLAAGMYELTACVFSNNCSVTLQINGDSYTGGATTSAKDKKKKEIVPQKVH